VIVSVFQAVTQIQEATLSFIPKLVAVMVVLALLGNWMLNQLLGYTITLFGSLGAYAP
jgi:flagellar biosynthetic protein FliQ